MLRSKDDMVYGFNASSGAFMVSSDGGRSWDERETPGAMVDLAIDPADPAHVVARGSIGGQPAAFASAGADLYAALTDASVKRSADGGAT